MKRNRNSKIVATIGPSTNSSENLAKIYSAGVDVFRLNFSHGSHEDHAKVYSAIRNIGRRMHSFPTIIADLQGPKVRVGTFENKRIVLQDGNLFRLDSNPHGGDQQRVCFPHPEILEVMKVGTLLLLDDGKLQIEVVATGNGYVDTKVLVGGPLSDRKGVNIPNLKLPIPCLTPKDLNDLDFALGLGVDWVVLSMIQSVEDVETARGIINGRAGVMSKLEKPLAIEALEPIVEASDAIMIGRGDLGVEMDQTCLPSIQKNIVKVCRRLGRPVIVATQMLESMITAPVPTRAEVSDVATAVYQGTDATMLSAESASGQYPLEAIGIMSRVIERTESDPTRIISMEDTTLRPLNTIVDALSVAACDAAEYSCASAIVLFTDSFDTVARCSRLRPRTPIVLVTDSVTLAGRSGLCNGVFAVMEKKEFETEKLCANARSIVADYKYASPGDNIVIASDISDNFVIIQKL